MFDEPTQGVDVATKLENLSALAGTRVGGRRGCARFLGSSSNSSASATGSTLISEGRVVDEVDAAEATEERIIGAATGHSRITSDAAETAKQDEASIRKARGQSLADSRYASSVLLALLIVAISARIVELGRIFVGVLSRRRTSPEQTRRI